MGTAWGRMHVGAFRGAGAEVVAICGRDPARTLRVAAEEDIALGTTDPDELVRASELVVVASPATFHAAHARAAIAGGRHVLIEKPLAGSLADAEAIAPAARTTPNVVAMSFAMRFLPPIAALRRWLHDRGPVRQLVATVRSEFAGSDASGDFGGASHALDLAAWLVGARPEWVNATLAGRPVNTAAVHVGFVGGSIAFVTHRASIEPGTDGVWELVGDAWEARFTAGFDPARGGWVVSGVRLLDGGVAQELAAGVAPTDGAREPWAEAHVAQAQAVLTTASGIKAPGLATFEDGLTVVRLVTAALEAHGKGARVSL